MANSVNENIVTGKSYRILKNAATALWDKVSFWTKASDVEIDNKDSQGQITGTQSLQDFADNIQDMVQPMTGATSSTAGEAGLVPAPAAGDDEKCLKGDGTWGSVVSLPTGGTAAQMLEKQSSTDGDAAWADVATPMTWAQYDALTTAQKNDGRLRLITDRSASPTDASRQAATDTYGIVGTAGDSASTQDMLDELADRSNDMFATTRANGAHNLLQIYSFDTLKTVNTIGDWSGNVFTPTGISINFTVNADGTITVNGTTGNDGVSFRIWGGTSSEYSYFNGKLLSGCFGGASGKYDLIMRKIGETSTVYATVYDGEDAEISGISAGSVEIDIRVLPNTTVSNAVFKPMIRVATDGDKTYAPYAMTNRDLTYFKVNNPEDRYTTSVLDYAKTVGSGVYNYVTTSGTAGNPTSSSSYLFTIFSWVTGRTVIATRLAGREMYMNATTDSGTTWAGWIQITPHIDSISVTADGTKTYRQLLNQLFSQVSHGLSDYRTTTLRVGSNLYHASYLSSSAYVFTGVYFSNNNTRVATRSFTLSASDSEALISYAIQGSPSNLTIEDLSTTPPSASTKIYLYY